MERQKRIVGFNRWMDEYIKNPDGFLKTQTLIKGHLQERADGEEPTYGELCEATLTHYATI